MHDAWNGAKAKIDAAPARNAIRLRRQPVWAANLACMTVSLASFILTQPISRADLFENHYETVREIVYRFGTLLTSKKLRSIQIVNRDF